MSGGYGDVHIVSLDGFAYDFQAVGEDVAARGSAGGTSLSADSWRVSWNSGETITVSEQGICLDWQVAARDRASVQGLLGPRSAPWSYLWLPDGTMVRQARSNEQIVGVYADGWRVPHSLFEPDHAPL